MIDTINAVVKQAYISVTMPFVSLL